MAGLLVQTDILTSFEILLLSAYKPIFIMSFVVAKVTSVQGCGSLSYRLESGRPTSPDLWLESPPLAKSNSGPRR